MTAENAQIRLTKRMSALIPQPWRFAVLSVSGRYPITHRFMATYIGSGAETLVRPGTSICIEAPPGSGNSFLVKAFSMANPDALIAHHHHVPAQIKSARRLQVPTLVILRDPIDCVLARVSSVDERAMIGPNLRMWISFWDRVEPIEGRVVCVRFQDIVGDPSKVVDVVNAKFGTRFNREFPSSSEVFAAMRDRRAETIAPGDIRLHPNVPDAAKAINKERVRPLVLAHKLAPRAQSIYRDLSPN